MMSTPKGITAKGRFGWYELMTTDTAAAATFYASVVGWTTKDVGMPGMPYTVFGIGDHGIAGMLDLPAEAKATGTPPMWMGYIGVEDCDAHVAAIVEAGGKQLKEAMDVPGMLRFAVVADPQGAAFMVFTPNPNMNQPADPPRPPTPGTVNWHELLAGDLEPAFEFYSELFGWKKDVDFDMGAMGAYRLVSDDERQFCGMMTKPPQVPMPMWNFYFQVESVKAAAERVKAGGGQVTMGPMQVPDNSWVIEGIDPQGVFFKLGSKGE